MQIKSILQNNGKEKKAPLRTPALGILYFFSLLYRLVLSIRLFLYRHSVLGQKKLEARVISVGNITVGGTGKTPLVIYLAENLGKRNKKAAVLTRGYKRKKKEMVELTHETRERINWEDVGDEPYLLAKRLVDAPIMVSKRRSTSGERARRRFGTEFLILDDGFQHLKLHRDLDIVVIDSVNPFGNGRLLPAGILREPLASLRRADIFVMTKTDQASDPDKLVRTIRSYNPEAPIVESSYRIRSVEGLFTGSAVEPKHLENKKTFAFSGIGNPTSFENSLRQLNVQMVRHQRFPDHHPYSKKDLMNLVGEAKKLSADLVITTEKDSVRIPSIKGLEIPFFVLRIDLEIIRGEEIFLNTVEGRG